MKKILLALFLLCGYFTQSQILRAYGMTQPTTAPTLSVTRSFTPFSNVTGAASTPQSIAVSGAALTANGTATAGTGMEVSLSSGSGYGSTVTITEGTGVFTGQPISLFYRIAAATGVGSYSGNLVISSTGASPISVPYTASVSSPTGKDSARFEFDSTVLQTGVTHVLGDPSKNVLSGTAGIFGTMTYTTVSTSANNWSTFSGNCMFPNNGQSGLALPNYLPSIMSECAFNNNFPLNASFAQFDVGGLKTDGTTYDIQMSAALGFNLTAITIFSVLGNSGVGMLSASSFDPFSAPVIRTFSTVLPDASGHIKFYVTKGSNGEQLACLSWIIIKEH